MEGPGQLGTWTLLRAYQLITSKLPKLPFQLLSSLFSSRMGVLLSVEEWERRPEPVLEIDIRDFAGLMEDSWSVLLASFRERCWRTLIMASFSMI